MRRMEKAWEKGTKQLLSSVEKAETWTALQVVTGWFYSRKSICSARSVAITFFLLDLQEQRASSALTEKIEEKKKNTTVVEKSAKKSSMSLGLGFGLRLRLGLGVELMLGCHVLFQLFIASFGDWQKISIWWDHILEFLFQFLCGASGIYQRFCDYSTHDLDTFIPLLSSIKRGA